jgi:hypothetical protein
LVVDEPGVRVYQVSPGNCKDVPPKFEKFLGYYPFEINGSNIADTSGIPGSPNKVVVIERNGFPGGFMFPASVMPGASQRLGCFGATHF